MTNENLVSSQFAQRRKIIRSAILLLLIIELFGPWMFDRVFVPAEYNCSAPNVRLSEDFCGVPISGIQFFGWFAGGFFDILFRLFTRTFTGHFRELLTGLYILPLIPFFTTLLLIWRRETRALQTINLIAWTLAVLPSLFMFILQMKDRVIQLWGLWLYTIMAISVLIFEISIRRWQSRLGNKI